MADCKIGSETCARIAAAWPAILADISNGGLVSRAIERHGLSRGMIRAYLAQEAGARLEWDDAREASADAFMDDALDIAYNPAFDAADARVRVDTLKWAARIRNPRAYSDKATLDVNVRQVDLTRIIEAAAARLAVGQVGRVLDADIVPPALLELL